MYKMHLTVQLKVPHIRLEEKLEQSFKAIRQQTQDRKMIVQKNIFIELLRSTDIYL